MGSANDCRDGGGAIDKTIQDFRPKLRFCEPNDPQATLPEEPYDMFTFFGGEMNAELFREQFRDMFLTRKGVRCRLTGTYWRVSRGLIFTRSSPLASLGGLVIKRAETHILAMPKQLPTDYSGVIPSLCLKVELGPPRTEYAPGAMMAWADRLWVVTYAYALQIYFDFSGYTDIALGTARLAGVRLPENFATPYLKPNLAQFWNSWHMTLTQWIRSYFFNPFNRWIRGFRSLPSWLMILAGQLATMLLIGLWHGATINFVLWGLWHGFGLFFQNWWNDFAKTRFNTTDPRQQSALRLGGIFLTFNFVTLGWVFFALSGPELSWIVFRKLLGMD